VNPRQQQHPDRQLDVHGLASDFAEDYLQRARAICRSSLDWALLVGRWRHNLRIAELATQCQRSPSAVSERLKRLGERLRRHEEALQRTAKRDALELERELRKQVE
jgi:hypothetical protein